MVWFAGKISLKITETVFSRNFLLNGYLFRSSENASEPNYPFKFQCTFYYNGNNILVQKVQKRIISKSELSICFSLLDSINI
jgi:hypothetical protein